ncbi:hypothetical protein KAW50_08340, partial [candidate division WOR-3 bacterium]|nr:hypothetical protein [candidate division WOR-3 bacterium]
MKAEMSLDGKWLFKSFSVNNKLNFNKIDWDATKSWDKGSIPGSVQGDLLKLGKVPNPFFERGAEKYRWIEQKEWWYQKEFNLPRELNDKKIYIRFEGLDTIAIIYLNGKEIGKTQNMFTPYEFEITDMLNKGKNKIAIGFASTVLTARKKDKRGIMQLLNDWYTASYIRKGNFAYGEDMSQRMITVGIWKSVKLTSYDKARILDCQIISKIKDKKAVISLNIEIEKLVDKDISLNLQIRLNGKKTSKDIPFIQKKDKKIIKVSFQIDNPDLWWPNGIGKQNLYSIEVELRHKNMGLDIWKDRFGIREVKLLQEKDKAEGGKTFTFVINGVKVFAKGANWVPADNLMFPIPKERYRKLIRLAKEANFNMF